MIVFGDAHRESSAGPFEQAAALWQTITTLSTLGAAARSFYNTLLINLFYHVLRVMGGWSNQT